MKKSIHFAILILIIILLTTPSATTFAGGDFTFNPSFEFRGEYDDNINFDNRYKICDWLGVFIPSLKARWQTPRLNVNGSAAAEIRRFNTETRFNDEYQRYRLDTSYQVLERLSVEAGASYTKDSTLDSELEETGIVENLYGRDRYTLSTGIHYQLGERVATNLNYSYGDTSYDSPLIQTTTPTALSAASAIFFAINVTRYSCNHLITIMNQTTTKSIITDSVWAGTAL